MVTIDLTRDSLFDELGLKRLRESYMNEGEVSPQERFSFIAEKFGSNSDHAQRIYDYASKHWLSFSTPILSFGKTKNGLPISCFLSWLPDTSEGLVNTLSEVNWLSMFGGGVGIGVGIRSADDKSTGIMPHLKIYDASCLAYRQGKTRRGSYAVYLDISHPDIIQFLEIRKETGDPRIRCENLHHGINIPDSFMEIIKNRMIDPNYDDSWELIDPNSKKVISVVSALSLWIKILELRIEEGEPYLHFIDTSNRLMNPIQKSNGLKIRQSNLCTEITLVTDEDRTAVCCLSSLNLEHFDEWKNEELFIHDVAEFLDNVLQYFIDNAPSTIERAKFSAYMERSIGIGALGFHAYLQQKNIPFESPSAKASNKMIFKHIKYYCDRANRDLGTERGSAPDMSSSYTPKRFSNMQAIAPNATSSIIMQNTSPSIEPYRANAYRQDTLSGAFLNKNRYLDKIIQERFSDRYDDIWSSIISNKGSIQHLDEFTDHEKMVFKTAMEIDQRWIIDLAADRQHFIDQAQSINVFFPPDTEKKYLHLVHFGAWQKGIKSLYYCRSSKIGSADNVSIQIRREKIAELDMKEIAENGETCLPCEG